MTSLSIRRCPSAVPYFLLVLALILPTLPKFALAQGTKSDYARASALVKLVSAKEWSTHVTPHWLPDGRLWYRLATAPGAAEWILANADGQLTHFDSAAALQAALGSGASLDGPLHLSATPSAFEHAGDPVELNFVNETSGDISLFWIAGAEKRAYGTIKPGTHLVQGTYQNHAWEVRDGAGAVLGYVTAPDAAATVVVSGKAAAPSTPDPATSPDGHWQALVKDDNVYLRPVSGAAPEQALSHDGRHDDSYRNTQFFWSPDSSKLVAFRTEAGQERKLNLVASSPAGQVQPQLISVDYPKPGDRIAHPRPVMFDLAHHKAVAVADTLFPEPWNLLPLGAGGADNAVTWAVDSKNFFFAYNQRGHQLMRVISVDAASGLAKALFEDRSRTFIDYATKYGARYLAGSGEILWMSERDGWSHLYLYDARSGRLKRQLTRGEWPVRGIVGVDQTAGTLLLQVSGRKRGEDPYHVHYVRVAMADGAITELTDGDGTHEISFSPDGSRYLDRYSRADLPTVTELHAGARGERLAVLAREDAGALLSAGWRMPERFVAKGRDGRTDIWGLVWRPTSFRAAKHYPVIEKIYAGPHGSAVPKQWSSSVNDAQELAELGFIVVQIDGMGTNWRGKAFQDVSYKNLKDAGFPDRILWMQALARQYAYIDLARVGIYGGSAGGQNALAALLWYGDFYKVAVADSGCHDNRMDKMWWNELWMGYPVDQSYADSSNVVHAAQLMGKLLLTVGELDTNVDPASTLQVADALIKADKDFELIVFPGAGHGAIESPYGRRRRMDFFVKNLLGVEPRAQD